MKTPHCKEYVPEPAFYWCGENPSHCSASGGGRGQMTPSIIKNMCLKHHSIIYLGSATLKILAMPSNMPPPSDFKFGHNCI